MKEFMVIIPIVLVVTVSGRPRPQAAGYINFNSPKANSIRQQTAYISGQRSPVYQGPPPPVQNVNNFQPAPTRNSNPSFGAPSPPPPRNNGNSGRNALSQFSQQQSQSGRNSLPTSPFGASNSQTSQSNRVNLPTSPLTASGQQRANSNQNVNNFPATSFGSNVRQATSPGAATNGNVPSGRQINQNNNLSNNVNTFSTGQTQLQNNQIGVNRPASSFNTGGGYTQNIPSIPFMDAAQNQIMSNFGNVPFGVSIGQAQPSFASAPNNNVPAPVYGPPPQQNDIFEQLPAKFNNGRLLGKATYTYIGTDGITRAVDGSSSFQATNRRPQKLGIPSAAQSALAGGGLG